MSKSNFLFALVAVESILLTQSFEFPKLFGGVPKAPFQSGAVSVSVSDPFLSFIHSFVAPDVFEILLIHATCTLFSDALHSPRERKR